MSNDKLTKQDIQDMIDLGVMTLESLQEEVFDTLSCPILDDVEDIVDPDNEYFVKRDFRTVKGRQRRIAIAVMAVEYLKDHNYKKAAARANIPQTKAKGLYMDRLFLQTVHELIDIADPDIMIQLQHVLAGLMKEANSDYNSSGERTSAFKEIARLCGMDPAIKVNHNIDAPIIQIITEAGLTKDTQEVIELGEDGSIIDTPSKNGSNGNNGHGKNGSNGHNML